MYSYDIFLLTQSKGKRIIDIGCGFGVISLLLGAYGAAEVVGYDSNTEKIEGFDKLLRKVPPPAPNVRAELGDAMKVSHPDESFDVVIANDVISHVRNLNAFLQEVRRLLKPNGQFYIYDDNNALFFPSRSGRRRLWKQCEEGP